MCQHDTFETFIYGWVKVRICVHCKGVEVRDPDSIWHVMEKVPKIISNCAGCYAGWPLKDGVHQGNQKDGGPVADFPCGVLGVRE